LSAYCISHPSAFPKSVSKLNHSLVIPSSFLSEKLALFRVFEQNAAYVKSHNSAGDSSYTLALNAFADLTPHEFSLTRLGLAGLKTVGSSNNERGFTGFGAGFRVPDSVDWRKQGAVTKVKDQGSCGESYLFVSLFYYFRKLILRHDQF
jgi:hypothetical protein